MGAKNRVNLTRAHYFAKSLNGALFFRSLWRMGALNPPALWSKGPHITFSMS